MLPRKTIVDNICEPLNRQAVKAFRDRVERILNQVYFELASDHSWQQLRRKTELDFTAAVSTGDIGLWLPGDLLGIDRVWDEDNEVEFFPRDRSDIELPLEDDYRFFLYSTAVEAEFQADDAIVEQGGTTFTSDALDADGTDYTDEYVKFGTELGLYKLTAAKTFTPTYHGPAQDLQHFEIRPRSTQKLVLVDPDQECLIDRTVNVHYWQAPQPLYRDEDVSILPRDTILELLVLRRLPEAKGIRPVSEGELAQELAKTKALNPDFPRIRRPTDFINNPFRFDPEERDLFGNREDA